jgi:hypothetical protein
LNVPLTYVDRNTASKLGALPFMGANDLLYRPGPPQFQSLTSGTLGNLGTPQDGFDSLFTSVASILDADITAVGALDTILTGVGFVEGALDAALFSPIAKLYAPLLVAGEAQLGKIETGLYGTTPDKTQGTKPCHDCAWQDKCKKLFPWGYDPTNPGGGDPCTP